MFLPHFTTAKNVYIIKECQNEKKKHIENWKTLPSLGPLALNSKSI